MHWDLEFSVHVKSRMDTTRGKPFENDERKLAMGRAMLIAAVSPPIRRMRNKPDIQRLSPVHVQSSCVNIDVDHSTLSTNFNQWLHFDCTALALICAHSAQAPSLCVSHNCIFISHSLYMSGVEWAPPIFKPIPPTRFGLQLFALQESCVREVLRASVSQVRP